MASHGFEVPAGTVMQNWPLVTAGARLPVHHHGAVPASKPPLVSCSAPPVERETLSRQKVYADALPPTWKTTCTFGLSDGEKADVKWAIAGPSVGVSPA